MNSQLAENNLLKLLRNYYLSPVCHSSRRCRAVRAPPHIRTLRTTTSKRNQTQGGGLNILLPNDEENSHVAFRSSEASLKTAPLRINNANALKPTKNIAVIGGGITGLTTAYYISQQLPKAQITLFERSPRLGGWMRTEKVSVGEETVIFEQGPRTIRPSPLPQAMVTLELVTL